VFSPQNHSVSKISLVLPRKEYLPSDTQTHPGWREAVYWTNPPRLNLTGTITQASVLRFYSLQDEVTLQCDASETGLGATLLQLEQANRDQVHANREGAPDYHVCM